jgi:hypothetical protein
MYAFTRHHLLPDTRPETTLRSVFDAIAEGPNEPPATCELIYGDGACAPSPPGLSGPRTAKRSASAYPRMPRPTPVSRRASRRRSLRPGRGWRSTGASPGRRPVSGGTRLPTGFQWPLLLRTQAPC